MSCCDWKSPKGAACLALRLSFSLALLFHGIALLKGLGDFTGMVSSGLGPLSPLGMLWAYVLPVLMIVGGALLAVGKYTLYGAWAAGLALASIAPGMLLKPILSDTSGGEAMASANMAFMWLLVYYFAVKCASCCGNGSGSCGGSCDHSGMMKH